VGPMHKYKRAEEFYDNLDIVVFVVKLLTEMSGDQSCKKELVCNVVALRKYIIMVILYRIYGCPTLPKRILLTHHQ